MKNPGFATSPASILRRVAVEVPAARASSSWLVPVARRLARSLAPRIRPRDAASGDVRRRPMLITISLLLFFHRTAGSELADEARSTTGGGRRGNR